MKISPTSRQGGSNPVPSAGPYTGYRKNYRPTGSTAGSALDRWVAENVLGARDTVGTFTLPNGQTVPMKYQEAGVSGVVGEGLKAGAKAAGRAALKGAAKSSQTVGDAVGKDVVAAVTKSVAKSAGKKPIAPLRSKYKTDIGYKKAQDAYKVKAEAWNKANPSDMITVTARVKSPKVPGGKTSRSIEKDVQTSRARMSAGEKKTQARGNQRGKSRKKAIELEMQDAAANSRTSVNVAERSPVGTRAGSATALPKGVTKADVKKFASKPGRTPAEAERAAKDLEDTIGRQLAAKRAGERPGSDVPLATGETMTRLQPKIRTRPARVKATPKQAPKEALREEMGKKVGKLKGDASPKSPAKEIAANEAKRGKGAKPGTKRPSAKTTTPPKATSAIEPKSTAPAVKTPSAGKSKFNVGKANSERGAYADGKQKALDSGSTMEQAELAGRDAAAAWRKSQGMKPRGNAPTRTLSGGNRNAARRGITTREGDNLPVLRPKTPGKKPMSGKKKFAIAAAASTGALGAAALAGRATDGGSPPKPKGATGAGRTAPKETMTDGPQYDKYGRRVSRAEKAKRIAYRANLSRMRPEQVQAAREKEMARRKEYRKTEGVKKFGKREALKRDENINVPVGVSLASWQRMTPAEKARARESYRMVKEYRKKKK